MIVWLASYPRSGNTFFRLLLKQIYGINTYSIHNNDQNFKQIGLSNLLGYKDINTSLPELAHNQDELFIVKTHYLPSDSYPAIYLVRDGRDSLVSYAYYQLKMSKLSFKLRLQRLIMAAVGNSYYKQILRNLITSSGDDFGFGSWSENVNQWTNREAPTVIVKYEDLIKHPIHHVQQAIEKLEGDDAIKNLLSMKQDREKVNIPSFEELHRKSPNFFRQGQTGSWEKSMNKELHELFWQFHEEAMNSLNYER